METPRKIASYSELRAIAAAGAGYVVDPFNRRWHVATCPRIQSMTVGAPKWFAPTPAALDAYLRQRLAQYPTAKPILGCTICGRIAGVPPAARRASSPSARTPVAGAEPRPLIRRAGSGFEVWAGDHIRNDSRAASAAGYLRRMIAGGVRALPEAAGRVLHASYAGQRWRGTDVENLLFNNIDQEMSLFGAPGRLGVRFEDLGLIVPQAPDGKSWKSFYSYAMVEPGLPFAGVAPGRLICRVPEAIVPDGLARLAARVWLVVRRARPPHGPGAPPEDGDFLLSIAVHGLPPAKNVKAVVDGATAAMQRDDPGRVSEAVARLSVLLCVDAEELLALATAFDAPLGSRSRSSQASKESLFTLDGAAQVRVTPDDDRCIAAEVVAAGNDGPPRLAVEVYSAERWTLREGGKGGSAGAWPDVADVSRRPPHPGRS